MYLENTTLSLTSTQSILGFSRGALNASVCAQSALRAPKVAGRWTSAFFYRWRGDLVACHKDRCQMATIKVMGSPTAAALTSVGPAAVGEE